MRDNRRQHSAKLIILVAGYILSQLVWALPNDTQQPLRVEADSAVRDESKGQTIYSGDVKISQGSLIISADSIVILEKNDELDSIVAKGSPATLSQQLSADGERVYASGNTIKYDIQTAAVQILVDAQLTQGGSKISSQQITYNVRDQIINAQSAGSGSRVEMVIPAKMIANPNPEQENP